jgi:transketolase
LKKDWRKQLIGLEELARRIRIHCVGMTHNAKSSHIGSCLSIADILAVLYGRILRYKPDNPRWEGRDRFILSKGHASAALYATLAECGYFPIKDLDKFYQDMSGHASHYISGVEVSTGSLGHGLSIGCGMALATKQNVYVLISEGDCDEGQTWEAAMFASHHKLDNLAVIIDCNGLQALGKTSDILNLEPLDSKWESFGWNTKVIDGHNIEEIEKALRAFHLQPTCIIAHTIKGKGVSCLENKVESHYKYLNDKELSQALMELK